MEKVPFSSLHQIVSWQIRGHRGLLRSPENSPRHRLCNLVPRILSALDSDSVVGLPEVKLVPALKAGRAEHNRGRFAANGASLRCIDSVGSRCIQHLEEGYLHCAVRDSACLHGDTLRSVKLQFLRQLLVEAIE